MLSSISEPLRGHRLLTGNEDEDWFFVPEFADRKGRPDSPFVVFNKRSQRWSRAEISRHAHAIYPVQRDPHNHDLIWFGANDSAGGTIIEWIRIERFGAVDDPLIFSGEPGGLGVIDTRKRTIRYFGPFRDLVSGRVSQLLFDEAAVWVWGRSPGNTELNGIARFDRQTATFAPYPIQSKGFDDAWEVVSLTNSSARVSVTVLEGGEWFNRYEFYKPTRRWRTTRYGWVSTNDVPMFERPDERSPQIDLLRRGMHFGKQGHDHFGHPIVVLDDTAGWQRVLTCRNVVGWIRTGSLTDTLAFVRAILRDPATARDFGNAGPRMFLGRSHLYMTRQEAQDAIALFSDTATPANVKPVASRNALGLELAGKMWQAFETRRRQLR